MKLPVLFSRCNASPLEFKVYAAVTTHGQHRGCRTFIDILRNIYMFKREYITLLLSSQNPVRLCFLTESVFSRLVLICIHYDNNHLSFLVPIRFATLTKFQRPNSEVGEMKFKSLFLGTHFSSIDLRLYGCCIHIKHHTPDAFGDFEAYLWETDDLLPTLPKNLIVVFC